MNKHKIKLVEIYTDGACSGNPGPGGWAAVLLYQDKVKEIYGFEENTTNQRMELTAVVQGLQALKVKDWEVKVYTDSAYIANAFAQDWISNWVANGWLNASKKPVANQDLWQELVRITGLNRVQIIKVPGHQGVKWNERCDYLARQAIKGGKERRK